MRDTQYEAYTEQNKNQKMKYENDRRANAKLSAHGMRRNGDLKKRPNHM